MEITKKYLKHLITERIPNAQFVESLRKNEAENIVLQSTLSKVVDLWSTLHDTDEKVIYLKHISRLLREELLDHRSWSFNGSLDDFSNPPLLQFFLCQLLFGRHVIKVSETRNEEVHKTVDMACQFLTQNTRGDRQVQIQTNNEGRFLQTVQTPLSIGLSLAVHSRFRDKSLINNLSEVYIGSDYRKILNIEKRLEQGILQRMVDSGGFCLPDFVKKGINVTFAVDNIDLLEDTPTGQNTFHGTVSVINQRAVDGEPLNRPIVVPNTLSSTQLTLSTKYLAEPIIKNKPVQFQQYKLGNTSVLNIKDYTHSWVLANYLATDETVKVEQNAAATQNDKEPIPANIECLASNLKKNILTEKNRCSKISKEDVMPTWAATKSLLLSCSSGNQPQTNSRVIAPLLRTSPTDYGPLYTALMLCQGVSAVVVGPERRTMITLDLDLYSRALKIQ